ncbi:MAG: flagellar hook-basal body complex protein FliE [Desulfobacterium sp.]|jgi:flagellar hook-basal body complex protein FliE|nr:flagellar hook-basal body complex protein FliE [Desulfobacterium sp.]
MNIGSTISGAGSISSGPGKTSLVREPLNLKLTRREPSFVQRLNSAVKDVNSDQNIADEAAEQVIAGELGIHEGMLALGKADTSLKLLVQVRGKVMEAYKTIINMQI